VSKRAEAVLYDVQHELRRAMEAFAPMASAHEGYAVILEELDELWQEIRADKGDAATRRIAMRHEAIQVAAMALRFVVDVVPRFSDADADGVVV
jgi:hypothetical protein